MGPWRLARRSLGRRYPECAGPPSCYAVPRMAPPKRAGEPRVHSRRPSSERLAMHVSSMEFHTASRIWRGEAISTRGHRYQFGYRRGRLLWCEKQVPYEGEGTLWWGCGSWRPRTLNEAVRASLSARQNLRPAGNCPPRSALTNAHLHSLRWSARPSQEAVSGTPGLGAAFLSQPAVTRSSCRMALSRLLSSRSKWWN